ncbi:Phospholipid/glycerol acyltransferase domain-containing protein [Plasmodiophora brassicae]|uniref:Phospholipid/glycerol acyltransferase domain-containing protein n=1 Tax=Plasmodiophora brassicae TaxID=37360 RepID=A0A3P3Y1H2_PLABS|nr:unnamed protein product [Plasmodiophora brassicae]
MEVAAAVVRWLRCLCRCLTVLASWMLIAIPVTAGIPLLIVMYITVKPLAPTVWAQLTTALSGWYYFFWVIDMELLAGTKVVFTGDTLPFNESVLVISNHCSTMDPFYMFTIAARRFRIGNVKFFAKKVIQSYFPFGPAMALVDCIFIDRDWTSDRTKINEAFESAYNHPTVPIWMMSFLEGRRMSEANKKQSDQYAAEHGMPMLHKTLYPRTKGLWAIISGAGPLLDAVYDVTLKFPKGAPSVIEFFAGGPKAEVHMHVRRIPIADIPAGSIDELKPWLYALWKSKDDLLMAFEQDGRFPGPVVEEPLSVCRHWTGCVLHGLLDERRFKDRSVRKDVAAPAS